MSETDYSTGRQALRWNEILQLRCLFRAAELQEDITLQSPPAPERFRDSEGRQWNEMREEMNLN